MDCDFLRPAYSAMSVTQVFISKQCPYRSADALPCSLQSFESFYRFAAQYRKPVSLLNFWFIGWRLQYWSQLLFYVTRIRNFASYFLGQVFGNNVVFNDGPAIKPLTSSTCTNGQQQITGDLVEMSRLSTITDRLLKPTTFPNWDRAPRRNVAELPISPWSTDPFPSAPHQHLHFDLFVTAGVILILMVFSRVTRVV